jgi:hypothetical protein
LGQVLFQRLQRLQQMLSVFFGHAGQCLPAGDIAALTGLFQSAARGRHEMEKPSAPVGRMRVPFDQPQRLKLVDDAAKRDRLDVEQLREPLFD